MISKDISNFLNELSDDLLIVNKLIVGAYLQFNKIAVENNKRVFLQKIFQ